MTFMLETLWCDETLDLGGFGVWPLAFTLWLDFSSDDEFSVNGVSVKDRIGHVLYCVFLPNIIFLVETKESSNFGCTLGTESLGLNSVGQTWNIIVALLDDCECQNREILSDDAATDRFALAFTGSAWAVAGVTIGEEKADTSWEHLFIENEN